MGGLRLFRRGWYIRSLDFPALPPAGAPQHGYNLMKRLFRA